MRTIIYEVRGIELYDSPGEYHPTKAAAIKSAREWATVIDHFSAEITVEQLTTADMPLRELACAIAAGSGWVSERTVVFKIAPRKAYVPNEDRVGHAGF